MSKREIEERKNEDVLRSALSGMAVAGFEIASALREVAAAIRELGSTGNASEPAGLYVGNALRDIAAALAERGER